MAEAEKSKKVRPKENNIFTEGEATAVPLDVVNVTSLADIFDTAFTSSADPASHPRYPAGESSLILSLIMSQ